jgi:hypothetical protein
MPGVTSVTFTSISGDSGSADFNTNDNSLTLAGTYTATNGNPDTVGIWLSGGEFGSATFVGSFTTSLGTNTPWSLPLSLNGSDILNDGTYTVSFKFGNDVGAVSTAGGTTAFAQTFTVDTAAPVISNIVVAGNDSVSLTEAQAGFTVTGDATGADGQTITVNIVDPSNGNAIVATQQVTVSGGTWSANFPADLDLDPSHTYGIQASVSDVATNPGSGNDTFTTEATVCFMPGTKIATPAGEINVETLKIGDLVCTTDGHHKPISWIGRQTVSRLFADPLRTLPVRIKAGAIGENLPCRDLLISPDHAILIDGVLVHAAALVNGTSIVRETAVPQVYTYYHIELEDHSLILAENVAAETFVDNVDRLGFDNWAEHEALYPNGKPIEEMIYPRAKSLRQVPQATRNRLVMRGEALYGGAAAAVA